MPTIYDKVKKKLPIVAMDYPEHEITYKRFLTLVGWSVISVTILLIGMAIFLT